MTIESLLKVINRTNMIRLEQGNSVYKTRSAVSYICELCGKISYRIDRTPSRGRFCSHHCASRWKHDVKAKTRGYEGWRSPEGYLRVKRNGKCFLIHREIMEKYIGRKLAEWEEVHHRNGDKGDNRITNLMVVSHTKHWHEVTCPKCEFKFKVK